MTMILNKERGQRLSQENRIEELNTQVESLQRDIKMISSPAARAAATRESKVDDSAAPKDTKKDLAAAQRQVFHLFLLVIICPDLSNINLNCL